MKMPRVWRASSIRSRQFAAGLREMNRNVVRPRCRRNVLDLDDLKLGHHFVEHRESRVRFAIARAPAFFRPLFSVEDPHGFFLSASLFFNHPARAAERKKACGSSTEKSGRKEAISE